MNERIPSRPSSREPGLLARLALLAGLAVTPKAMGSEDMPSRATAAQADQTREDDVRAAETLRASIAAQNASSPSSEAQPVSESARPSPEQVGQQGVDTLLSEGDVGAFLAQPGDATDFSAQALDDVLMYRDSHLERLPTIEERRAVRRRANDAIVQAVQRRIDEVLSGRHGGTTQQQRELAVALSTAFSMMFDAQHRTLHSYSLEGDAFIDSEPTRDSFVPGVFDDLPAEGDVESDAAPHESVHQLDPATDDPEDYQEDSEPAGTLDPNAAQR